MSERSCEDSRIALYTGDPELVPVVADVPHLDLWPDGAEYTVAIGAPGGRGEGACTEASLPVLDYAIQPGWSAPI